MKYLNNLKNNKYVKEFNENLKLIQLSNNYRILIVTFLIIISASFILNLISKQYNKDTYIINNEEYIKQDDKIYVYISGEVNYDGMFEFNIGITLKEVLDKIGGLTEDADISKLDLDQILTDKQKIIIPSQIQDEEVEYDEDEEYNDIESEENVEIEENEEFLININTATIDELTKLDGIGTATAEKILEYRESNEFESIEDIMEVSGIGETKFENIRKDITVD